MGIDPYLPPASSSGTPAPLDRPLLHSLLSGGGHGLLSAALCLPWLTVSTPIRGSFFELKFHLGRDVVLACAFTLPLLAFAGLRPAGRGRALLLGLLVGLLSQALALWLYRPDLYIPIELISAVFLGFALLLHGAGGLVDLGLRSLSPRPPPTRPARPAPPPPPSP